MEEFYDYDDGDYEDEDMIKSNNDLHEWSQEYLKKKKFLKRMEMVMKMKWLYIIGNVDLLLERTILYWCILP